MHPIQPVHDGSAAARPYNTRPVGNALADTGAGNAAPVGGLGGEFQQIANVISQIQELMGGMGGGMSSQDLRMIIGLLILMAILEAGNQESQGSSPQASPGGGGGGGSFLYFEQSYSHTSISIEQTTMTSTAIIAPDAGGAFGDGSNSSGEQIDLSA